MMNKLHRTFYINYALRYNYIIWHEFPLRRIDWANLDSFVFWEWDIEIDLDVATVLMDKEFIIGIAKWINETYTDLQKYNLWSLNYKELIDYITVEHAYALRDNTLDKLIARLRND